MENEEKNSSLGLAPDVVLGNDFVRLIRVTFWTMLFWSDRHLYGAAGSIAIKISWTQKLPRQAKWGAIYLFIANFFATQIICGAKERVVLLWLSGDIWYKQWTKRVCSSLGDHKAGHWALVRNQSDSFSGLCLSNWS